MIYKYDKKNDILNIMIFETPVVSEEEENGIYINYKRDSNEIIGLTIENFKKCNVSLNKLVPFKLKYLDLIKELANNIEYDFKILITI